MKKILSVLTVIIMLFSVLSGCGKKESGDSDKIKIVTSSFSAYDWTKNILGEKINKAELTLLSSNGVDMHSYQPTTEDIVKISDCDLLIYVGGSSEEWIEKAIKSVKGKNIRKINMLDALGDSVLAEEKVEGMTEEHTEHDHYETEMDEHIWLSLRNAVKICDKIKQDICDLDPQNADYYTDNTNEYKDKLYNLDSKYTNEFKSNNKPLIFADRFPFRYLTADYGLSYFACFPGCSSETDASFDSVIFLAEKIDESNIKTLLVTESSDKKIAKVVIENTRFKNQDILVVDSLQTVTEKSIKEGINYLSVMEKNLENVKKALE